MTDSSQSFAKDHIIQILERNLDGMTLEEIHLDLVSLRVECTPDSVAQSLESIEGVNFSTIKRAVGVDLVWKLKRNVETPSDLAADASSKPKKRNAAIVK
jgi:hypothetical protein